MSEHELARCIVIEQARKLVMIMLAHASEHAIDRAVMTDDRKREIYSELVNLSAFAKTLKGVLDAVAKLREFEKAEGSR